MKLIWKDSEETVRVWGWVVQELSFKEDGLKLLKRKTKGAQRMGGGRLGTEQ